MRVALLVLTALLLAGVAGTASAHYLVEQDSPAGHLCVFNEEDIVGGVRAGDVNQMVAGIIFIGDC